MMSESAPAPGRIASLFRRSRRSCSGWHGRWPPSSAPIACRDKTSTAHRSMSRWIPNSRSRGMNMFLNLRTAVVVIAALAVFACSQEYQNIPPNYIAMKLTPSGYEDTIYTPGQVDIGTTGAAGQGNQLVFIQSSGVEVKEQFLERDPGKPQDPSDHRCM